MLAAADLRTQFPPFADSSKYPDAAITAYLTFAYSLLSTDRWGTSIDMGAALFTAHFLALDAQAAASGANGVPGIAVGVLSGGGVDKVNYTRDIASVMEENAGHWGMTTYGLRYLRFARMMGMGPMYVGADDGTSGLYNGAWPGPMVGYW